MFREIIIQQAVHHLRAVRLGIRLLVGFFIPGIIPVESGRLIAVIVNQATPQQEHSQCNKYDDLAIGHGAKIKREVRSERREVRDIPFSRSDSFEYGFSGL